MMRCIFMFIGILSAIPAFSQPDKRVLNQLTAINKSLVSTPCSSTCSIISNRAMNVFLADKTSYVAEKTDLSFYTNYVSINTAEGKISISHNFQKNKGIDDRISRLFNLGITANIFKGSVPLFLDKMLENEVVLSFTYKWLGKVKTKLDGFVPANKGVHQKRAMDALRAAIIHLLIVEIKKKESEFEKAMAAIDSTEIPEQNMESAKLNMRDNFHAQLLEEYALKFAKKQAEVLSEMQYFKIIATHFTNISINAPVMYPKYYVASSLITKFQPQYNYPFEIMLNHTRFWESPHIGRLFFTFTGKILNNNSVSNYELIKTNNSDYKNMGGSDSNQLATFNNNKAYIGLYKNFITPSLSIRGNYFPPSSHIGISILLTQTIGTNAILNARLGLPIVLINNKKVPAVNCEFFVLFYDVNNNLKWRNTTSVGLGVGIPFSRLMY